MRLGETWVQRVKTQNTPKALIVEDLFHYLRFLSFILISSFHFSQFHNIGVMLVSNTDTRIEHQTQ